MKARRRFTLEFKGEVALQLLSGEQSMAELCRTHQLTSELIGHWKQQFLAAAGRAFEREADRSAEDDTALGQALRALSGESPPYGYRRATRACSMPAATTPPCCWLRKCRSAWPQPASPKKTAMPNA